MSEEVHKIVMIIPNKESKTVKIELKERKNRKITTTEKWQEFAKEITVENKKGWIGELQKKEIKNEKMCELIKKEIIKKISGYRTQDVLKKLLEEDKLVDTEKVIDLLEESELKCYYCKELVEILYEKAREPKQWTLDRIDNSYGHNKENVVIACLDCNVHRKTMYHERFAFTKQLNIVKIN